MIEFFNSILSGISMTQETRKKLGNGLTISWRVIALFLLIVGTFTIRSDYYIHKEMDSKQDTIMLILYDVKYKLVAQENFRLADMADHGSMKNDINRIDGDVNYVCGYLNINRNAIQ